MNRNFLAFIAGGVVAACLAGCTVAPAFESLPADVAPPPYRVAESTAQWLDRPVVWGGMIIEVFNFENHSEIEVLAFPLDDRQRPMLEQKDYGRFIAIVPGYVEAKNFPQGRYLSLIGRVTGDRRGKIRESEYVYPEVDVDRMHLWDRDFRRSGPRISVGVGIGF
jgi:outer membrane lipoprotein